MTNYQLRLLTRMMYYLVMTQANSEKEIPGAPMRESNLRRSDYKFGRSTTELQETDMGEPVYPKPLSLVYLLSPFLMFCLYIIIRRLIFTTRLD